MSQQTNISRYILDVAMSQTEHGKYYINELVVFPLSEDFCEIEGRRVYHLFKLPHHVKSDGQIRFASRNIHGLRWDAGTIPYYRIRDIFRGYATSDRRIIHIYTKGVDKIRALRLAAGLDLNLMFVNIEDMGSHSYRTLREDGEGQINAESTNDVCTTHRQLPAKYEHNCAVFKALLIAKFLARHNIEKMDYLD